MKNKEMMTKYYKWFEFAAKTQIMIRKSLKRGDSVEDITELLEIDAATMDRFLEQIKKEDNNV